MQHQDLYNLTWQSYSDHLREALREMITSHEFTDVTLVTDDKQQIRAHRNILSACSPVFKNILQIDSNNTNPVIYLRGIQHSEMESIMQFIYMGEARFYEERMSEFIMVSKNLEIKDLLSSVEMKDQTSSNKDNNEHEDNFADEEEDTFQSLNEGGPSIEPQTNTSTTVHKAVNRGVSRADSMKYNCTPCDKQFSNQSHLSRHIKSKHEGVKYACNQCDYQAIKNSHLTTHIKSAHEGVKYTCNQCDQQYTTENGLNIHIQAIHQGVRYACDQCTYQATTEGSLTVHIQSKHEGIKKACK